MLVWMPLKDELDVRDPLTSTYTAAFRHDSDVSCCDRDVTRQKYVPTLRLVYRHHPHETTYRYDIGQYNAHRRPPPTVRRQSLAVLSRTTVARRLYARRPSTQQLTWFVSGVHSHVNVWRCEHFKRLVTRVDQRSYSTPGLATAGMRAGKPPRLGTSHAGQLSLLPSVGRKISTGQSAVTICGSGVKTGMLHST